MDKYVVLFASGGRTGTNFFGKNLSKIIDDCFSIHEPDLFEGFNRKTFNRIKTFGLYHMVLGRFLGKTGIRNISQKYLSGRIDCNELRLRLLAEREKYYQSINQNLVVESYYQWYGALDAFPGLFSNYKIIGIIRDPRFWVTSWINHQGHYDDKDLVQKFGFKRLNPALVGDPIYATKWPNMTNFEKLCWAWTKVNSLIVKHSKHDKNCKIMLFEELFGPQKEIYFTDLLEFITKFTDKKFAYDLNVKLMDEKVNVAARNRFPDWEEWSPYQARSLWKICGPMMSQFGYGKEKNWLAKINT